MTADQARKVKAGLCHVDGCTGERDRPFSHCRTHAPGVKSPQLLEQLAGEKSQPENTGPSVLSGQSLRSSVHCRCGFCGCVLVRSRAEVCWRCMGPLCGECWDAVGRCEGCAP